MRLIHRLRYLLLQRRHERELAEEIESHRQMVEDRQRAAGLSEQDARNAAHRSMGNATLASEDARSVWIATWVQSVFQDLGYAARSLRSQPGFTALALLALALGTGVNTSLFTLYNALVLRPWPVRDPGSVVRVSSGGISGLSLAEYRYLNSHSRAFAGLSLESRGFVSMDGQADEPDALIQLAGGNYFALLGLNMALGRGFTASEDKLEAPGTVAVLNFDTWQTRYGGDLGILGRRIRVSGIPLTVIGVLNKDFSRAMYGYRLWAPLACQPLVDLAAKGRPAEANLYSVVGRLAPGVSREQARAELTTLSRQFQNDIGKLPHEIRLYGTRIVDASTTTNLFGDYGLLMAAVGSILLLSCANVSNLLLARAAARQREIAVRVSIGAGRARVVRQLLTESLLLASLASGLGLLLTYVVSAIVSRTGLPGSVVTPDSTVLVFSIAIAALSAALFGLAPALRATRISVSDAMKQQGAHASPRFPLRGMLLGVQVAISVALLMAAGVLIRGLWHARSLDLGYKTNGVAVLNVILPVKGYDEARRRSFYDAVVEQLKPFGPLGVGQTPPGGGFTMPVTLMGEKSTIVKLVSWSADAGYFNVLGIPIVAGRDFVPVDRDLHNILINETMARRYWPGQVPMGKSIFSGGQRFEIVGVVRDSQLHGPGPIEPTLFQYPAFGSLLLPEATSKIAADVVRQVEPRARVTSAPLSAQIERVLGSARAAAQIAVSLGALALFLATIGVYGVISYSVEQKRREIGIRMALGARSGEVLGFILRRNARAVVVGLAAGLAVFLAGSKLLESLLYGVSRLDPLAHGVVLLVLLAAAAAACVIPARRATRIAPVEALRQD